MDIFDILGSVVGGPVSSLSRNVSKAGGSDNFLSSMLGKYVGTNLTGAERESNEFAASEAQKNRDFQEQMSNTVYLRTVQDMKNAGLNPSVLLAGGAGTVSSPSGSTASQTSPSQAGDLLAAIMLPAQIANLNAQTNKTNREANEEIPARVANLQETNNLLRAQIQGTSLDNEQKEIVLKYVDKQQQFYTASLGLSNDKMQQEINESVARVNNLSADYKKIMQDIAESVQRVHLLQAETNLTEEQAREIAHMIKQIDANTALIVENTNLTRKDVNWYAANHIITPATNLVGDVIGSVGKGVGSVVKGVFGSGKVRYRGPNAY